MSKELRDAFNAVVDQMALANRVDRYRGKFYAPLYETASALGFQAREEVEQILQSDDFQAANDQNAPNLIRHLQSAINNCADDLYNELLDRQKSAIISSGPNNSSVVQIPDCIAVFGFNDYKTSLLKMLEAELKKNLSSDEASLLISLCEAHLNKMYEMAYAQLQSRWNDNAPTENLSYNSALEYLNNRMENNGERPAKKRKSVILDVNPGLSTDNVFKEVASNFDSKTKILSEIRQRAKALAINDPKLEAALKNGAAFSANVAIYDALVEKLQNDPVIRFIQACQIKGAQSALLNGDKDAHNPRSLAKKFKENAAQFDNSPDNAENPKVQYHSAVINNAAKMTSFLYHINPTLLQEVTKIDDLIAFSQIKNLADVIFVQVNTIYRKSSNNIDVAISLLEKISDCFDIEKIKNLKEFYHSPELRSALNALVNADESVAKNSQFVDWIIQFNTMANKYGAESFIPENNDLRKLIEDRKKASEQEINLGDLGEDLGTKFEFRSSSSHENTVNMKLYDWIISQSTLLNRESISRGKPIPSVIEFSSAGDGAVTQKITISNGKLVLTGFSLQMLDSFKEGVLPNNALKNAVDNSSEVKKPNRLTRMFSKLSVSSPDIPIAKKRMTSALTSRSTVSEPLAKMGRSETTYVNKSESALKQQKRASVKRPISQVDISSESEDSKRKSMKVEQQAEQADTTKSAEPLETTDININTQAEKEVPLTAERILAEIKQQISSVNKNLDSYSMDTSPYMTVSSAQQCVDLLAEARDNFEKLNQQALSKEEIEAYSNLVLEFNTAKDQVDMIVNDPTIPLYGTSSTLAEELSKIGYAQTYTGTQDLLAELEQAGQAALADIEKLLTPTNAVEQGLSAGQTIDAKTVVEKKEAEIKQVTAPQPAAEKKSGGLDERFIVALNDFSLAMDILHDPFLYGELMKLIDKADSKKNTKTPNEIYAEFYNEIIDKMKLDERSNNSYAVKLLEPLRNLAQVFGVHEGIKIEMGIIQYNAKSIAVYDRRIQIANEFLDKQRNDPKQPILLMSKIRELISQLESIKNVSSQTERRKLLKNAISKFNSKLYEELDIPSKLQVISFMKDIEMIDKIEKGKPDPLAKATDLDTSAIVSTAGPAKVELDNTAKADIARRNEMATPLNARDSEANDLQQAAQLAKPKPEPIPVPPNSPRSESDDDTESLGFSISSDAVDRKVVTQKASDAAQDFATMQAEKRSWLQSKDLHSVTFNGLPKQLYLHNTSWFSSLTPQKATSSTTIYRFPNGSELEHDTEQRKIIARGFTPAMLESFKAAILPEIDSRDIQINIANKSQHELASNSLFGNDTEKKNQKSYPGILKYITNYAGYFWNKLKSILPGKPIQESKRDTSISDIELSNIQYQSTAPNPRQTRTSLSLNAAQSKQKSKPHVRLSKEYSPLQSSREKAALPERRATSLPNDISTRLMVTLTIKDKNDPTKMSQTLQAFIQKTFGNQIKVHSTNPLDLEINLDTRSKLKKQLTITVNNHGQVIIAAATPDNSQRKSMLDIMRVATEHSDPKNVNVAVSSFNNREMLQKNELVAELKQAGYNLNPPTIELRQQFNAR